MTPAVEEGNMENGFLERHRSVGVVAFLALLVLLAIPCGCAAWWFDSTTGTPWPYPTPTFPIEELLLDESAFPEGWRAGRPFDPDHRIPAEQIRRHILTSECHPLIVGVGQEVYRFYGGASAAAEAYPQEVAFWFHRNLGDWSVQPEFSYKSPVAGQFRFGSYVDKDFDCTHYVALGQYEEYIVVLDAKLDPDHPECLSYTDLERILVAVDERMALYLGKEME